jgi:hypothetical protein
MGKCACYVMDEYGSDAISEVSTLCDSTLMDCGTLNETRFYSSFLS